MSPADVNFRRRENLVRLLARGSDTGRSEGWVTPQIKHGLPSFTPALSPSSKYREFVLVSARQ